MIALIMGKIKENNILILLLLAYFATRLYNLTLLPMFTDESIYIYWAKLIETTHSQWFISLYDGKPPLLILMMAAFLTILPDGWYLIAGRLPSVLAGALCLVGIYKLAIFLWKSNRVAVIASILYIIFPFNLFYDRMALFDSLLTSMLVWSVYYAAKTTKTRSIKDSIMWGVFLGLGLLSKPPALLFVGLTPLMFIILTYTKLKTFPAKKFILLSGIAIVVSQIFYNVQRLSGSFANMAIKNQQFQQPIGVLLRDPFQLTFANLRQFIIWMVPYYTLPILFIGCIAFIFLLVKNWRVGSVFLMLWTVPMFILATVGREIFPRYILFVTPYFIIPVAFFIESLLQKKNVYFYIGICLLFLLQLRFDFYVLTNPPKAAFSSAEYTQYISEHPSGYGLQPIFTFLDKEAKNKKITIVTQGTFGLYPYAFQLRYWDNKNVSIIPKWPLDTIDVDVQQKKETSTVYIILKEHQFIPGHLLLKEIIKGEKPGGKYPIYLTTFL